MLEVIDLEIEQRPRHGDAGVVDQPEQRAALECRLDLPAPAATAASSVTSNTSGVKLVPNSFVSLVGIALLAHAAEDMEAVGGQRP